MKNQMLKRNAGRLVTAFMVIVYALGSVTAAADSSLTVKSVVVDKTTGEPLIGVTVLDKANPSKGTMTDIDGGFSITVANADNTV